MISTLRQTTIHGINDYVWCLIQICLKPLSDGAPIKVRSEPGINNDIPVISTLPLNASAVTSLMKVGNWHAVEYNQGKKKFGVTFGIQAYIYAGQTRPCY